MRRILGAFKLFAYNHRRAKNYLERMFARLDKSTRKVRFKKWFKYMQFKNEQKLMKKEYKQMQVVNELKITEGEHQDENHMVDTKN